MDKHTEKVNDIEICTVPKGVLQYTHGVMEMSEYDKIYSTRCTEKSVNSLELKQL